jgi:hypothetical protein
MLHDLDLVFVQGVRSEVDNAYLAWPSGKGFSREQVDFVVDAGVPPESSIRDTVAGVTGRLLLEKRAPATLEAVAPATPPKPAGDFVCENDVLASVAEDGKMLIGPKTIVTPGARGRAARYDVLAQR